MRIYIATKVVLCFLSRDTVRGMNKKQNKIKNKHTLKKKKRRRRKPREEDQNLRQYRKKYIFFTNTQQPDSYIGHLGLIK